MGWRHRNLATSEAKRRSPWTLALLISMAAHTLLLLSVRSDITYRRASPITRAATLDVRLVETGTQAQASTNDISTTERQSPAPIQSRREGLPQNDPFNQLARIPDNQTRYRTVAELTSKPTFLNEIHPALAQLLPDVLPLPVMATIRISEKGDVDEVVLGDNFLSNQARAMIQESFFNMRFSPGLVGAMPVKSELIIEIHLDSALSTQDH